MALALMTPQHTAGRTMAEAASDLAPVFLKHGYAFLYLCRWGQGLSANQGPFAQDLLKQAEAKGADARKQSTRPARLRLRGVEKTGSGRKPGPEGQGRG